jgi:thiamine biosynthesis lipoprotein
VQSSKSKPKPLLKPKDVLLNFEAIGTHWTIELFGHAEVPDGLVPAITKRIGEFDKHYSRFRKDSLVTAMSQKAGTYDLPPDAKPLLDLYQSFYKITNGAMTPLIGQALSDAGYDANYSLQPKKITAPPSWEDALDYHWPQLTIKQPVLLDFGACGKGYLVDIISELLAEHGITSFLVNAGGDMLHRGPAPVQISLEHPGDVTKSIGSVHLQNSSLCGSAGNRRAWAQYHHILDPQRLASPTHIRAAWACADSTMLADALTTALFFSEPQALLQRYKFNYALVLEDYSLTYSAGFPATFFSPEATT